MDLFEAILTRRSIRKYKPGKISRKQVEEILKAAMYAPTARNSQTWRFMVVEDPADLSELSVIHPYGKMLTGASLAILVCGDRDVDPMDGYLIQNAAAATQNILLAAHGLGLGAVWLGVYPREQRMEDLAAWFRLPGNIVPLSLISVGIPDEVKEMPGRWDPGKVHYGRWES